MKKTIPIVNGLRLTRPAELRAAAERILERMDEARADYCSPYPPACEIHKIDGRLQVVCATTEYDSQIPVLDITPLAQFIDEQAERWIWPDEEAA